MLLYLTTDHGQRTTKFYCKSQTMQKFLSGSKDKRKTTDDGRQTTKKDDGPQTTDDRPRRKTADYRPQTHQIPKEKNVLNTGEITFLKMILYLASSFRMLYMAFKFENLRTWQLSMERRKGLTNWRIGFREKNYIICHRKVDEQQTVFH